MLCKPCTVSLKPPSGCLSRHRSRPQIIAPCSAVSASCNLPAPILGNGPHSEPRFPRISIKMQPFCRCVGMSADRRLHDDLRQTLSTRLSLSTVSHHRVFVRPAAFPYTALNTCQHHACVHFTGPVNRLLSGQLPKRIDPSRGCRSNLLVLYCPQSNSFARSLSLSLLWTTHSCVGHVPYGLLPSFPPSGPPPTACRLLFSPMIIQISPTNRSTRPPDLR